MIIMKGTKMNKTDETTKLTPSELITNRINELTDWRGSMYAKLRQLVNESSPNLKEEWKWGTATWTSNGLVCVLNAFKEHMKIVFDKGASLPDPMGLFNAGLGKKWRAIDFYENSVINEPGIKELIQKAVEFNFLNKKK
jgi:hypothetical protein